MFRSAELNGKTPANAELKSTDSTPTRRDTWRHILPTLNPPDLHAHLASMTKSSESVNTPVVQKTLNITELRL